MRQKLTLCILISIPMDPRHYVTTVSISKRKLKSWLSRLQSLLPLIQLSEHIVACHLPRGSKLQWRGDMGGKLPSGKIIGYTFTKRTHSQCVTNLLPRLD